IVGNRLWLESEFNVRFTYIHPLFTMFLRDRLCDQESNWEIEDIGKQAFAAYSTSRSMLMDQERNGYFQEAVLHGFLTITTSRLIFRHLSIDEERDLSAESPSPSLHTELYNFLFVCGLCTSEHLRIVPSKWPRDGFSVFLKYVLETEESIHYRRKCVEAVERLLCSLEDQYDQIVDDTETVLFWTECMSYLLETYSSKIPTSPEKAISKLSTISTFIGGLDQTSFDHLFQVQLLIIGDLCHKAAIYLADSNADDAEMVKGQATSFYHRALKQAINQSSQQEELSLTSEEERSIDSLSNDNAKRHRSAAETGNSGHSGLDEAEINLILEVRELEWQTVQQKESRNTDVNEKLQELSEQLSALLTDLPKRSNLPDASNDQRPGSSKSSMSAGISKSNASQAIHISNLASAYDDTDILSAAVNQYQLSARSWSDGKVEDTARHLSRLNELIRGDKELENKFSSLEQYTQIVGTASRAQDLAGSIESTAEASDYQSMEENWNEAYALLGLTPSPAISELQEAYRDMMNMQRECQRATVTLARLDPPLPRWEMRERNTHRYDSPTTRDISTDDQAIIDTAWMRSCTDAVAAVEKGEYLQAIGHFEIMEELQSGDLVTWHNSRPMTAAKRWLKEEDDFLNLSRLTKAAVMREDLNTADALMKDCLEFDRKLGNRHGEFLQERNQALQTLQLQGDLRQAKQQGESDHFVEAVIIIADIEKKEARLTRDRRHCLLNALFENDLRLAKYQIMMRFAVKEESHLDAAHGAQQCLLLLQQTSEDEMP
ncbi:MAG: hypothetical protein Q9195_007665, partial [Heterodermia aff. obscurata]